MIVGALPFILGGIAVVGGIAYFVKEEEERGLPPITPYPPAPPGPLAEKYDPHTLFAAIPENVWISAGGGEWGVDPDAGTPEGGSIARFYVWGGGGFSALEEAMEVYAEVVLPAAVTQPGMAFQIIQPKVSGPDSPAFTLDWEDPRWTAGTTDGPYYGSYRKTLYAIPQTALMLARNTLSIWPDPVVIEFGKALQNGITEKMKFDAFPLTSNKILVSSQCSAVVEGNMFWPRFPVAGKSGHPPGCGGATWEGACVSVNAEEAPSLAQALAIPNNSAIGYVDYVIQNDPNVSVQGITQAIIEQAAEMSGTLCPNVNFMTPAMVQYVQWLQWRVQYEANMSANAIPFEMPNP